MINLIMQIPAATNPSEVRDVFLSANALVILPSTTVRSSSEVLEDVVQEDGEVKKELVTKLHIHQQDVVVPASAKSGGRHIVHCIVSGITYQQLLDITSSQRPVWQIFGAQDLRPTPNPDYDPEDDQSPPTITVVYEAVNNSVWQFLPDRIIYDEDGNEVGTEQQTKLHNWVGATKWSSR